MQSGVFYGKPCISPEVGWTGKDRNWNLGLWGDVKKIVSFGGTYNWGDIQPYFCKKKTTTFCYFIQFNQEAFKTLKKQNKLLNLCVLSCL